MTHDDRSTCSATDRACSSTKKCAYLRNDNTTPLVDSRFLSSRRTTTTVAATIIIYFHCIQHYRLSHSNIQNEVRPCFCCHGRQRFGVCPCPCLHPHQRQGLQRRTRAVSWKIDFSTTRMPSVLSWLVETSSSLSSKRPNGLALFSWKLTRIILLVVSFDRLFFVDRLFCCRWGAQWSWRYGRYTQPRCLGARGPSQVHLRSPFV